MYEITGFQGIVPIDDPDFWTNYDCRKDLDEPDWTIPS